MEYIIGAVLALGVCAFGMIAGFDRERAFYATMLIVVATYYILFAVMGSSRTALTMEFVAACTFVLVAAAGFKKSMWLIAAGLAGHGVFDFFHGRLIENPGVPVWWPGFCLAYDVLAGIFLAVLLATRAGHGSPQATLR